MAKNAKLFEDKDTLPLQCVEQSLNIIITLPHKKLNEVSRQIVVEDMDRNIPWAYFDGASQGDPPGEVQGGCCIFQIHIV